MPQIIKGVVNNRFDTFANLTAANDIPYKGEIVFESDTLRFKVGDGTTAYNSLPYFERIVPPTEKTVSSSGAITLGNSNYIIELDTSAGDIAPSLPTGDFIGQTITIYASGANKAVLTGTGLYVNGVYYTSNTGKHTIVWEGAGWRHSPGVTANYVNGAEQIIKESSGYKKIIITDSLSVASTTGSGAVFRNSAAIGGSAFSEAFTSIENYNVELGSSGGQLWESISTVPTVTNSSLYFVMASSSGTRTVDIKETTEGKY